MSKREDSTASIVAPILQQAEQRLGPVYGGYVRKATPFILQGANACDKAYPYVVAAYAQALSLYALIQPYKPERFLTLVWGIFLCFFGGAYMMLVAAYEALRLTVMDRLSTALGVLYRNYRAARIASKKDDEQNGAAVSGAVEERLTQKVYVFLRAVNPDEVNEATSALWAGLLTVLATMRLTLAQCITFGYSLGGTAHRACGAGVEEGVKQVLPPELQKWAPRITKQGFAAIGVLVALMFQRVITGFHSAVQGGEIAVKAAIVLLKQQGKLGPNFPENSREVHLACITLSAVGFYYQFSTDFGTPFPFGLLFLPASIIEWVLSVMLSIGL